MYDEFQYDVFLSHSSKDKPIVRDIARRLKKDGIRVWLDEEQIKPGDNIPAKIEEGLEHSRVLLLVMSANAFGSDWAKLESYTFRFRDPLNKERRFIPLRLDDAPVKGSLAQFLYIEWFPPVRKHKYAKVLEACRPSGRSRDGNDSNVNATETQLERQDEIWAYAFSPNGKKVLSAESRGFLRLSDFETGRSLRVFEGGITKVCSVAWSRDERLAISGSYTGEVRLWDVETGRCLGIFAGHKMQVQWVAWSFDQSRALSASFDQSIRMWDVEKGRCLCLFEGHTDHVNCVAWSPDQRFALSGSDDSTLRLWDVETGSCLRVLEGHTDHVNCVAWSPDQRFALSGSDDRTLRLWDMVTGNCLRVFEGHTQQVYSLAWNNDLHHAMSGDPGAMRLWDVMTGRCLQVYEWKGFFLRQLSWGDNQHYAFGGDLSGRVRVWNLSEFVTEARAPKVTVQALPTAPDQIQYTNAKVLLVGESGVGKTGLSKRLASDVWEPSDSTVGAWATQWKLPVSSDFSISKADKSGTVVEREIWLWDFGGQADQRLIHQLYMDETALAVLVFDGQKEGVFETLGQWDRDLTRASRKEFAKLLVAGRVDAGGLRVSRSEVERFAVERKFRGFLETSAKKNVGCEKLKRAILAGINWDAIPCRTTEVLFKRLKEEIIRLKDEGRVLMRFNELRETLQLRLSGEFKRFADEEMRTVLSLLAGPCVVWELAFGSWVLLQPERINAYAQAVIRTLQADEHQRGCLMEERVLKGDLAYESSMPRLAGDEERFVLLAMHQTLVERGLCLRQPTAKGNLLVFPSYYRRERPEQVKSPAVLVDYRFTGFLDEIYATLVVRLHHTDPFQQDQLWHYAADFKTNSGKHLGVKLTRRAPGMGELEVYFDPAVAMEEKIIFSKYVHEHLLQHARDVERLRQYVCPRCGTPVGNRELAMKRVQDWLQGQRPNPDAASRFKFHRNKERPTIICAGCEQRVLLWDDMEQCFASPEIQQRVRDLQEESKIVLDNESRERALVGEVISTVALAGQNVDEYSTKRNGLDMEVEFKDDDGKLTGRKLYLQLKSGDSFLCERRNDKGKAVTIENEEQARFWISREFTVLLVIRNSEGEVRWMDVRDWLGRESEVGKKPDMQIVFESERFDVMSIRRWREKILASPEVST
jgi:WD40 repeat protein